MNQEIEKKIGWTGDLQEPEQSTPSMKCSRHSMLLKGKDGGMKYRAREDQSGNHFVDQWHHHSHRHRNN